MNLTDYLLHYHPMRIAIISDIHSNLEALQQTLTVIKQKKVDAVVCLGDIIGYGANPNECLSLIRETTPHVLLGNHDEAALDVEKAELFNPYARVASEWTHRQLTDDHRDYIKTLPLRIVLDGLLFVHASPFEPEEWHYIITQADAQLQFAYFQEPVCFVGHSHVAGLFCEDLWMREVVKGEKFIVNVGSIGQPRDNDWRSSFGIFDTSTWTYENPRVEYDAKTASSKILQAGLPKPLAQRILVGR